MEEAGRRGRKGRGRDEVNRLRVRMAKQRED